MLGRFIAFLAALAVCALQAPQAAAAPRVALLVGNANYAAAPKLANPVADTKLVAEALRRAGFATVSLNADMTKSAFEGALRTFAKQADGAEVALIYYAGHGLEVGGRNWLIPTDATLAEERDLPYEAIDLDMVLNAVAGAKGLRMVVLDACRDNPFSRSMRRLGTTRSLVSRGLAEVEVTGTLVLYAQRAGETASDGVGGNSPFARALAARIPQPGVDIRLMVSQVRDDVLAATARKQEPFSYGSLPGVELELVPAVARPAVTDTREFDAWGAALDANTMEAYRSYLAAFPSGRFATRASAAIARLAAVTASPRAGGAPPAAKPQQCGAEKDLGDMPKGASASAAEMKETYARYTPWAADTTRRLQCERDLILRTEPAFAAEYRQLTARLKDPALSAEQKAAAWVRAQAITETPEFKPYQEAVDAYNAGAAWAQKVSNAWAAEINVYNARTKTP